MLTSWDPEGNWLFLQTAVEHGFEESGTKFVQPRNMRNTRKPECHSFRIDIDTKWAARSDPGAPISELNFSAFSIFLNWQAPAKLCL
jgi:hypothetical protein